MSKLPAWLRRLGRGGSALLLLVPPALAGVLLAAAVAAPPAGAQERLVGVDGAVALEVRKGRVIQLDRPAAGVFVADPEIADVQVQSPTLIYLFGRRTGTTSVYAVGEDGGVLLRRDVVVSHSLTRLREALRLLAPDAEIQVGSVDQSIVVEGEVSTPVQAQEVRELAQRFLGDNEALINRVRVAAATQVNLRVRVAEVSREVNKEFGINWEAVFSTGNFIFGFATGRDFVTGDSFFRSPTNAGSGFGGFRSGSADVNTIIDALAQEGLITVLAEPNLTALSGETASFLAGGEFPIPVAADNNEIQIEFKEFGVSLAFTPTVLSPNRISLKVRPEVSELSTSGAITLNSLVIPGLATRRAETTVELGSGQSFAIGGLLSNGTVNDLSKLPGLGDLPVLGTLFRSSRFQRKETELVIIVTPYIVRPADEPGTLAMPTDGLRAPTDLERILGGQLYGVARLQGSAGFMLE
ncbi:MAG TPA: type II and III secretion system protein family protein [Geminicoccaceae bacterium]|nr:type II and III secretion system protein family protein [Geminicoccaceae bacterium]